MVAREAEPCRGRYPSPKLLATSLQGLGRLSQLFKLRSADGGIDGAPPIARGLGVPPSPHGHLGHQIEVPVVPAPFSQFQENVLRAEVVSQERQLRRPGQAQVLVKL